MFIFSIFGIIGEIYDLLTSETRNPNLFEHDELDRHQEEIWALCGGQHGLLEAVKGQPHTYQVGNRRFAIVEGVVITL